MTICEECKRFGYIRTNQKADPCALCGELRCEDHMIWVPAHEIEKPLDETMKIANLIKYKKVGGYFGFCGKPAHVPRGFSIRHGKEKEGGKIVKKILDHEKRAGLECFQMWEIGSIEEGFEISWDVKRYALSCSLAPVMTLIANMYKTTREPSTFLEHLYTSAFKTFAIKKPIYFLEDWNSFSQEIGSNPTREELFSYTCSKCAVIPCINRQAPFYDQKVYRKLVSAPDQLSV